MHTPQEMSDAELVERVTNDEGATERELELADRLDRALGEVAALELALRHGGNA